MLEVTCFDFSKALVSCKRPIKPHVKQSNLGIQLVLESFTKQVYVVRNPKYRSSHLKCYYQYLASIIMSCTKINPSLAIQ